jgi:ParB-like chromosome segregation protein Spo0J
MAEKLKRSFEKHDYVELCVVNLDGMIIAGHQRIRTMKALGWEDREIEVRVPDFQLDQEHVDDYLLTSNKVTGDFDQDMLSSHWEEDFLEEIGWTRAEFGQGSEEDEEVEGIDPEEKLAIEVTCETEEQQRELYEELQQRGLTCRLLTL